MSLLGKRPWFDVTTSTWYIWTADGTKISMPPDEVAKARNWLEEQHKAETFKKVPMADMADGLAQLLAAYAMSNGGCYDHK